MKQGSKNVRKWQEKMVREHGYVHMHLFVPLAIKNDILEAKKKFLILHKAAQYKV